MTTEVFTPQTYSSSSSIPVAINNLICLAQAVFPSNYYVYMGSMLSKFTAPITFQIESVTGNQKPAELAPSLRREETYQINCCLWSWEGDQGPFSLYDRLTEVFDAWQVITVAIANDPHLTGIPGGNNNAFGAVRFAQCSAMKFMPTPDKPGMSLGTLGFSVFCEQRITSLT